MSRRKVVHAKNLDKLTPEQRAALATWMRDMRKMLPAMQELERTAKSVYQAILDAPTWTIVEGEPMPGNEPSVEQLWNVGAPQVNYVDHIEPIATESSDSVEHRREGKP